MFDLFHMYNISNLEIYLNKGLRILLCRRGWEDFFLCFLFGILIEICFLWIKRILWEEKERNLVLFKSLQKFLSCFREHGLVLFIIWNIFISLSSMRCKNICMQVTSFIQIRIKGKYLLFNICMISFFICLSIWHTSTGKCLICPKTQQNHGFFACASALKAICILGSDKAGSTNFLNTIREPLEVGWNAQIRNTILIRKKIANQLEKGRKKDSRTEKLPLNTQ